jgi:methanogenic corrinoid protein MtbC1
VVIGGAPVNDEVRAYAGADLWAPTAMDTVAFANKVCAA